jgi:WD40 repeat protein
MKFILAILISVLTVSFVFGANANDALKFKGKIGFKNEEDKILSYRFFDNESKVLIIGEKNVEIWDIESLKILHSVKHDIPQFEPRGFISNYVLLGLPRWLDWRPFLLDRNGKWIITSEKVGANKLRSGVIRRLPDLKQIGMIETADVSVEYVSYYPPTNEILTFGTTEMKAAMGSWDIEKFTKKELIYIDQYKWHQAIQNSEKLIVGSGDTKFVYTGMSIKHGNMLTLRDVKTGKIEKEFVAPNAKPNAPFQHTTISNDEKYLISKRDDRIFVWEIDGNGQPKFEVSNQNPKGSFNFKEIVESRFIVAKIDKEVRIFDIYGDSKPILTVVPQNPKEDVEFKGFVNARYAVIKADNKIRIYDTKGGENLKFEITPDDPKDTVEYRGNSKDGRFFAINDDKRAAVYEFTSDSKPLYEIRRTSAKERFYTVRFIEEKNLFAVSRVNNSEKKSPRTEFYELSSGKIAFETPFVVGYDLKFTPDDQYFYDSGVGWFTVWNMKTQKAFSINLETAQPSNYDTNNNMTTYGEEYNTEYVKFSPDYRYILRYGDDITAVFEISTGQEVQKLFDAEKAKFDKNNKLKKSGYGDADWTVNGKYVYALDESGLLGKQRTISFWELTK